MQVLRVSDLPSSMHHLIDGDPEIRLESSHNVQFGDLIILPGHFHDIRESAVNIMAILNLKQVGDVHLVSAANANIYRKQDATKPAWVLCSSYFDTEEFFVYKFYS